MSSEPRLRPRRACSGAAARPPDFDTAAYLERIGYTGPLDRDAATLAALQKAHLESVPFENLDVYFGRGVGLDIGSTYDKIVRRGRGGWCFELNGLFAALLAELGFDVTLLATAVADGGVLGPDFDHLALLVRLDRPWLVDVGFGDSTHYPLALDDAGAQDGGVRRYRVDVDDHGLAMYEESEAGWTLAYSGRLTPRRLDEFAGRCTWLQSSPASNFRQKPFCTRATPDGRVTLLRDRLKTTVRGETLEEPVAAGTWAETLQRVFGMRP